MYKVFINGNILFIAEKPVKHLPGCRKITVLPFHDGEEMLQVIELFENHNSEKLCYCITGSDLPLMWRRFKKYFQLIVAGGGLVRNDKDKILFIFRNGKWDLPKGKVESDEEIEMTALREVKEECGITNLLLIRHLTDTYHTYGSPMSRKLKRTSWYSMYTEDSDLIPQKNEGISKVKWKKPSKIEKLKENTYANILDVLAVELTVREGYSDKEWHDMTNFE
ncbi:MAG: NUDIX domain-containing protein [Candidatus Competibacteraceae bacterium]|nr:NUDIX domain-containing protein [Candidatus Competibacteraceae bacterium]